MVAYSLLGTATSAIWKVMHGGKSTGPPRGNRNAWKHGRRSAEAVAERKARTAALRELRRLISLARWLLADSSPL